MMKKRIFSRVLALAMALVLLSSTAFAAQVLDQENIGTFTGESGELLAHDGNGNVATSESENSYYDYYLGSDIVLDKTLVVQGGADAEIDLNGHTLQLNNNIRTDTPNQDGYYDRFEWVCDKSGPVIKVTGEDTSLTVMDQVMEDGESSRGDETGIITGSNNGGISVEGGSEFTLSSGKITKNQNSAVNVKDGTFNMTGGVICDNRQNAVAGGVFVGADGTCNISGGEITHNWSGASGGGLFVGNGGTVNITGGKITDNFTKSWGGAVYVGTDGTFTMSGGEISENEVSTSSSWGGGAVCVRYNGTFEMAGGKIVNNTAAGEGGAVSVANNGNFKMTAGEISGNTAGRGSVMAFFRGTYTNNGVTISLDLKDGKWVIDVTDTEGNSLEYALDGDNGSHITAGEISKGMNLYYWNKVLYLLAPPADAGNDTGDNSTLIPGGIVAGDFNGAAADADATIADNEVPLAGLVSLADLLNALRQYEGIEDVELPEDFQWIDHEYAQAIY